MPTSVKLLRCRHSRWQLTLQGKVKCLHNDFHTYKLLAIAECKIDEFTPRL